MARKRDSILDDLVSFAEDQRLVTIQASATQTERTLARIESKLDSLIEKVGAIMATQEEFDATLAKLEADEQDTQTLIAALRAQIDSGNLTAAQEQTVLDRIKAIEATADAQTPDAPPSP